MSIVDTPQELTPEWFTATLREGGTLSAGLTVREARSRVIGTGQVGIVALSELEYEGDGGHAPASLVVKLPHTDAGSRRMGMAMGLFESEVRFYEEIAPRLGDGVPRMHWGSVDAETGRFTLVIDDLTTMAQVGDSVTGGTLEQAMLCMTALARLHAPTFDDPVLVDRPWLSMARSRAFFAAVAPSMDEFANRFADRVRPEHLALARRIAPLADGYMDLWRAPLVVAHGDFRLDNVMFGRTPAVPPVTVIDWQAAKLGPPLLDAAIYLGSCLQTGVRRAHQAELLATYQAELERCGVAGFSPADCEQSFRVCSIYPFLLTVVASVMLVRTERGDQMWTQLFTESAELVADTDAAALLT